MMDLNKRNDGYVLLGCGIILWWIFCALLSLGTTGLVIYILFKLALRLS